MKQVSDYAHMHHALTLSPLNVIIAFVLCIALQLGQMAVVYQPCQCTASSVLSTQERPQSSRTSSSSSSSSHQDAHTFRHYPSSCENGSELPSPDAILGLVTLQDVLAKIMTNPTKDDGTFCGVLVHCPYSENSSIENRSPNNTSMDTVWMSQQRISNRTSSSSTVVWHYIANHFAFCKVKRKKISVTVSLHLSPRCLLHRIDNHAAMCHKHKCMKKSIQRPHPKSDMRAAQLFYGLAYLYTMAQGKRNPPMHPAVFPLVFLLYHVPPLWPLLCTDYRPRGKRLPP